MHYFYKILITLTNYNLIYFYYKNNFQHLTKLYNYYDTLKNNFSFNKKKNTNNIRLTTDQKLKKNYKIFKKFIKFKQYYNYAQLRSNSDVDKIVKSHNLQNPFLIYNFKHFFINNY
jgi:hypothetical protein